MSQAFFYKTGRFSHAQHGLLNRVPQQDPTGQIVSDSSTSLCAIAECFICLSYGLGVHLSVCLSVRPSVRPSHSVIVSKWRKLGSQNLYCRLPQDSIVSCAKILCPCVRGFPSNEGVKEGYPLKKVTLPLLTHLLWKRLQIGTDMWLIITSTGHGLFGFITIGHL